MAAKKSKSKKTPAKRSSAQPSGAGKDAGNGLSSFVMHSTDEQDTQFFSKLTQERAGSHAFALLPADHIADVDPETVAKRYLQQAFQSKSVPALTAPTAGSGEPTEFKSLGSETLPLTGTTTVKFRQTFGEIPVYGSLVTVELDEANQLLGINSSIGDPTEVSPIAKVSPADAVEAVRKYPGYRKDFTDIVPHLNYYFDQQAARWRLVFVLQDVPVKPAGSTGSGDRPAPQMMDYIVDANSGKVVAELPRTPSMASVTESAVDGKNASRQIRVEQTDNKTKTLSDSVLNVQTFDFQFDDPDINKPKLPGPAIVSPPSPWAPAAVSAHANAAAVADFLRTVLQRNNIDNKGGTMKSSINCVVARQSPGKKQWLNAFWNGDQMVYGQRLDGNNTLMSMAIAQDVVGHEMFHGVTDSTARLQYAFQSGALNESYSDIFGIIIANFSEGDISKWNWKIGEGLSASGKPIRNMQDPTLFNQPAHMKNYVKLPNTENGDWGGVHTNSGIHNKAAYNILTAVNGNQRLFQAADVAKIFYIAVTQYLSQTSQFSDSRRAAVTAARSLFRTLSAADLQTRVTAIEDGFSNVGIT